MTSTAPASVAQEAHDAFPINGTDYIEFWVGNAKQSAMFYRAAFGFQLAGYRGPETGVRDRASYLLVQDKLRFVLTSALGPEGGIEPEELDSLGSLGWRKARLASTTLRFETAGIAAVAVIRSLFS
jgi:hypothetical protein